MYTYSSLAINTRYYYTIDHSGRLPNNYDQMLTAGSSTS